MTKEELEKEAEDFVMGVKAKEAIQEQIPYFKFAQEMYLAGAEPREKRIAELEKENAELKKACNETQELLDRQIEATYKVVEKLNRAKEVINALLCIPHDMAYEELNSGSWDIVYKAEEFLKEE